MIILIPVSQMPLHSRHPDWNIHNWFGCSEPERPYDIYCSYDMRCEKCRLAAKISIHMSGDIQGNSFNAKGYFEIKSSLQDQLLATEDLWQLANDI